MKNVIFSSLNNSTHGLDGFTFEFYKVSWEVIECDIVYAIKYVFFKGNIPRCIKATTITLISIHPNVGNISEFQPISLCNSLYKIIAKILANRINKVIHIIIHKSQSNIIKKRDSTKNIILINDIFQNFRTSKLGKVFCAKLHLKKAFDLVSMDFILNKMKVKRFSDMFIQ